MISCSSYNSSITMSLFDNISFKLLSFFTMFSSSYYDFYKFSLFFNEVIDSNKFVYLMEDKDSTSISF
jgi:hypothetical protein